MLHISKQDIAELSQLGSLSLRCNSVRDLQDQTVATLDRIIGSSATVFLLDPEQYESTDRNIVFHGVGTDFQSLFHSRFHRNPYADWARQMRTQWTSAVALPSANTDQILGSQFYQEFMHPLGMYHMMAIGLIRDQRYLGLVGICRSERDPGFSETEVAKAELIASSLQGALERALLDERLQEMTWIAESLDDKGTAILDNRLSVRYAGPRVLEAFAQFRASEEREFDATTLPPALYKPVAKFADSHLRNTATEFQVRLPNSAHSVDVILRRTQESDQRGGFVLMLRAETLASSVRDSLRRSGLTVREIEVLDEVRCGLTNSQIADRLYISFFTVQSHLKSIYQKLDVCNRVGLLTAVARISSR